MARKREPVEPASAEEYRKHLLERMVISVVMLRGVARLLRSQAIVLEEKAGRVVDAARRGGGWEEKEGGTLATLPEPGSYQETCAKADRCLSEIGLIFSFLHRGAARTTLAQGET